MLDLCFQVEMVLDLQKLDALAVVFLRRQSEKYHGESDVNVPPGCLCDQRY
jgi:hypothetical protein